jgi:hypothetical protein
MKKLIATLALLPVLLFGQTDATNLGDGKVEFVWHDVPAEGTYFFERSYNLRDWETVHEVVNPRVVHADGTFSIVYFTRFSWVEESGERAVFFRLRVTPTKTTTGKDAK